jgi:signal transduction histidine kinase
VVPPPHLDSALVYPVRALESDALLDEITEAAGRISDLLASAKQYTQMDRAPLQTFDVHEGLDATLTMLGHKLGDGIEVVRDYDRSLPHVSAFPGELNQVWTNLIDNAVDAMDGHGTLTVRTEAGLDDRLVVEIGDTGRGVPDEVRSRIFEPFFTTKPMGKGTGLGLDIAWRIVVGRHHGDIRLESEPGDTRFQVILPLREPDAPPT